MSSSAVSGCQCPRCRAGEAHAERVLHEQMNLPVGCLGEAERRWYAAVEANRLGRGGVTLVARITGWTRRRSGGAGRKSPARSRVWKQQLQEPLCDRRGLVVTVCHYPTGCSKWNPIEHRLFGPSSLNWAGRPLATWDTPLGYAQGTTTETGLTVRAALHDGG